MRCAKCGAEVKPTDLCCPHCAQTCTATGDIHDVAADCLESERREEETVYHTGHNAGAGRRIYVRQLNFSRGSNWTAILGALLFIALCIFILPLAILSIFLFAVFHLIMRRR